MENELKFSTDILLDNSVLEKLAEVSESDIESAVQNWKVKFKDDGFVLILEADD